MIPRPSSPKYSLLLEIIKTPFYEASKVKAIFQFNPGEGLVERVPNGFEHF